jgi:hypothetical protein
VRSGPTNASCRPPNAPAQAAELGRHPDDAVEQSCAPPVFGEIGVDDAREVAVQCRAPGAVSHVAHARKPTGNDLGHVGVQADRRRSLDRRSATGEQVRDRNRGGLGASFGQRQGADPQPDDPAGARVRRVVGGCRRTGEQEPPRSVLSIDIASHDVPRGRVALPLVDEDRRRTHREPVAVSTYDFERARFVQPIDGGRALLGRGGLAHALRALEADRRKPDNEVIQLGVDDPPQVLVHGAPPLPGTLPATDGRLASIPMVRSPHYYSSTTVGRCGTEQGEESDGRS